MSDERLKSFLESGEEVNLGNIFEYLQGMAEGMEGVVRWEKRENIAGQSVRENDLQHTFKTVFLTIICAVTENEWRKKRGLLPFGKVQLDVGLLAMMALVHDIGEIIKGDMPHFEKIKEGGASQTEDELTAFKEIIKPLPGKIQEYLLLIYRRTMFKSDLCIKDREARFFNAVENLGHLKRAIHECRLGHLHFAPKCLELHIPVLDKYSWNEFPSLKDWYKPFVEEAIDYLRQFQEKREEYIAEFVRRGGKREDFPF